MLGASFGGSPALLFAAKHSYPINALVFWNSILDHNIFLRPKTRWMQKYFNKTQVERLRRDGTISIGSRGYMIGRGFVEELRTIRPMKFLKSVHVPMLFLHGDQDWLVGMKESQRYSVIAKHSTLTIIPGAHHDFHEKESDLAYTSTVDFFLKYVF
jgi:pimeloyl-ACP methyl ester carboxylesterase